jgi:hypothetical protein
MRTPSTRTLVALAYERGEEFDPSLWLSPALVDYLADTERARRPVAAPSPYERRRRRERDRREADGRVPGWLSPEDLAESAGTGVRVIHGELV